MDEKYRTKKALKSAMHPLLEFNPNQAPYLGRIHNVKHKPNLEYLFYVGDYYVFENNEQTGYITVACEMVDYELTQKLKEHLDLKDFIIFLVTSHGDISYYDYDLEIEFILCPIQRNIILENSYFEVGEEGIVILFKDPATKVICELTKCFGTLIDFRKGPHYGKRK